MALVAIGGVIGFGIQALRDARRDAQLAEVARRQASLALVRDQAA